MPDEREQMTWPDSLSLQAAHRRTLTGSDFRVASVDTDGGTEGASKSFQAFKSRSWHQFCEASRLEQENTDGANGSGRPAISIATT